MPFGSRTLNASGPFADTVPVSGARNLRVQAHMSFLDARADDLIPENLRTRTCIIGAGPAGLTLATELARRGDQVLLVEAGGFSFDGPTQSLYRGNNIGLDYFDLTACRLRFLGGTSNHWGGYCRPNDPIDYKGRPGLGVPAWPFDADDLQPYLFKAADILGVNLSLALDNARVAEALSVVPEQLLDHHSDLLETKTTYIARNLRFGQFMREDVESIVNLRCVLNLNAVRLVRDAGSASVRSVVAATTNGREFSIEADRFVICTHAIEASKILFQSTSYGEAGCGNTFDHVGRYFMEHPHFFASRMIPSAGFPFIYNFHYGRRRGMNVNLSLSERAMIAEDTLSYYCRFNPYYSDGRQVETALDQLHREAFEPLTPSYLSSVRDVLSDLPASFGRAMASLNGSHRWARPAYYLLEHRIEQAPNPQSRVILSDREDGIGGRVADLNWELNDLDARTFKIGQEIMVRELSALGLGRFQVEEIDLDLTRDRAKGHYHHIGTTRMAMTASEGVVDPSLKVFGVPNLYICGSSVFPTAGYSGPTMMIVALALRLADELQGEL